MDSIQRSEESNSLLRSTEEGHCECPEATGSGDEEPRRINWATWVPAFLVVVIIVFLWAVYLYSELIPEVEFRTGTGIAEITIFHVFLVCFLFNYFATMFKDPGTVPQDDPEWKFQYDSQGHIVANAHGAQEVKADGDRRRCKWCMRYKPDRCHHCRICKKCVLKMDHHCPWVNNCVGFHNHKNFILTCFYGFSCCLIISVTCLVRLIEPDRRPSLEGSQLGLLVAAMVLSFILFIPLISLYGFHIWLAIKGLSTIEFCEKRSFGAKYRSRYYQAPMKNLKAVLGDNLLSWFCCFGYPSGDGMHFNSQQSRTKVDLSYSKPTTTKGHKDKLGNWQKDKRDPELDRGSANNGMSASETPSETSFRAV